jgi:phosphomannomutase
MTVHTRCRCRYRLVNGTVLTLRGSGTEPKIKWYCEMVGTDHAETEAQLQTFVEKVVIEQMLEPKRNGLEMRK